jgi:hypothetical protein
MRQLPGAQRAGVVALVFRDNAAVALAGCAAGLVAAIFGSRIPATLLYQTSPRDPLILFGSAAALAAIAGAASLLPAIRAARIDRSAAFAANDELKYGSGREHDGHKQGLPQLTKSSTVLLLTCAQLFGCEPFSLSGRLSSAWRTWSRCPVP